MTSASNNVVDLAEHKRRRDLKRDVARPDVTQDISPGSLLSLNLANWIAANVADASNETLSAASPDMQASLYFAKARVYYYRGHYFEAASMFEAVACATETPSLRALSLLAYANAMFSLGEFESAARVADHWPFNEDLPEALCLARWLLQGNVIFAKGEDQPAAMTCFRKAFCTEAGSLLVNNLRQALAGILPMKMATPDAKNLKRLRDLLDAFIEAAASRYFVGMVLTIA